MSKELLRNIPKVDEILTDRDWSTLVRAYPEGVAKDALREYLDELRIDIRDGKALSIPGTGVIIEETRKRTVMLTAARLKRVINGTGIIIHTNLGRSILAKKAIDAIVETASHYSNLEYDTKTGERGDRYEHCLAILKKLCGGESALVVNNNAAAVFLVLNTLAEGKEVLISRGELVEIGGSFRIPDVMRKSGVVLKEVGTTNRTYIADYERAIGENTGLIMKAHTSNYRIRGFAHEASSEELTALGKKYNIPVFYDAGSGLLEVVKVPGVLDEPLILREVAKGFDLISFSGDKLLGGTQAGIIVGEKTCIDSMKKNPMTRAFRPDKFTLAGLESTLLIYLDMKKAKEQIPTLKMIEEDLSVLKRRARRLAGELSKRCANIEISATEVRSEVGGGSFPDVIIPSFGISLRPHTMTVGDLEKRLRNLDVPIIARIEKETLILDMRTILKEDETLLMKGLEVVARDGR